jgi:DNA-directed RNA polymerase beta subunit
MSCPWVLVLRVWVQVGLVKNLALMAYISKDSPTVPIEEVLTEYGMEELDETLPSEIALPTVTRIFVNGQSLRQSRASAPSPLAPVHITVPVGRVVG